jgi:hypothetical protein
MGISGTRSGGPDTTETGTDDGYQRVLNRRFRVSDRAPNAAPERRRSPPWSQCRTARRACSRMAIMLGIWQGSRRSEIRRVNPELWTGVTAAFHGPVLGWEVLLMTCQLERESVLIIQTATCECTKSLVL